MKRNFSGWGVTTAGLLLALAGGYAMWTGWDHIQLERGWSLFIAGSVAIAGGVVTAGLGRVIAHLARLSLHPEHMVATRDAPASAPAPAKPPSPTPAAGPPAPPQAPAVETKPVEKPMEEPTEVDRYTAGDATYVMYSDGSVEMRTAAGSERYASLAELRAVADGDEK